MKLAQVIDPDVDLEQRIAAARSKFDSYPSFATWEELKVLIKQRSREQVARMENERGLG